MSINISNINKIKLLEALWKHAKPAFFFKHSRLEFDEKAAEESVGEYIDYFQGRCIKCNLNDDTVDPYLYDRDWGVGAFKKIVEDLSSNTV
jgi:hypothetical protein